MNSNAKLDELRILQSKADALRKELGISRPGEITFMASSVRTDDDIVIVEADGLGGATTSVVVGNYPMDYMVEYERSFPTEHDAEVAAEDFALNGVSLR